MISANPFPTPIVLAPLADVSDTAFRLLNRSQGAAFAFTEMIHARSLCFSSRRTRAMLRIEPEDQPLGIQLLGNESYYLCQAAELLAAYPYQVLDLNAGCPQPKVVRRGEGAGLLQQPRLLWELLRDLVRHSPRPVTVKLRLGWDSTAESVAIARGCEDAGVAAVCVHGRTRQQGFSGVADYAAVAAICRALRIPVYVSGDIFSAVAARQALSISGAAGVFLARGALGNPWLARNIALLLNNEPLPLPPDSAAVAQCMRHHFALCCRYGGQTAAVFEFRKHFIWYTRGFDEVKILRRHIGGARTVAEVTTLIDEFAREGRRPRIIGPPGD